MADRSKMNEKLPKFVDVVTHACDKAGIGDAAGAELYTVAMRLDDLAERLESNARHMAGKFAQYADDCAVGRIYDSTPCGYSTLNDIVADAAKFAALKEVFVPMFRTVTGVRFVDAVKGVA